LKILFLDLETTPINAYTWGLWEQNVSLNQIVSSTEVICFGARWYGSKKVVFRSVHHHGKQEMLEEAHRLMDEADVVVGWNSANFDTKHLKRELIQAGMKPPSPYKDLDLMRVVKSQFKFPSNKLDYVAQTLKVGAKVKHSGFDLWIGCMAGSDASWREMKTYQIQDVNLLVDLYERLKPWIPNHPSVPLHEGRTDGCVACGSTSLQSRGVSHTLTATYQRYQCQDCGKWMRGSKMLSKATSSVRGIS
jgi:uncharacterized protein YprB with RNaseH-like and TPR domain